MILAGATYTYVVHDERAVPNINNPRSPTSKVAADEGSAPPVNMIPLKDLQDIEGCPVHVRRQSEQGAGRPWRSNTLPVSRRRAIAARPVPKQERARSGCSVFIFSNFGPPAVPVPDCL